MKIASFKQSFKAVGSLAKSYDPHKGDFVHAPGAYGKSEGEVCPGSKKGLSWAATLCWRVPISLAKLCNIPHANSSIPIHIPLTSSESKYSMTFLRYAQTRKTIILNAHGSVNCGVEAVTSFPRLSVVELMPFGALPLLYTRRHRLNCRLGSLWAFQRESFRIHNIFNRSPALLFFCWWWWCFPERGQY